MSHKHSKFVFTKGVATMVYGENLSDDEANSNGSGKSAGLEGICVALLNSSLRKVSTKDLVTDGEKSSTQKLTLKNTISHDTLYVERTIYSNSKSGEVVIEINDKSPTKDLTNVDDANALIIELLGISREDLLNYFLISKEKYQPFLSISDTKKKQVIARFSQADLIDPAFDEIDNKLNEIDDQIDALDRKKLGLEGKIEAYKEQLSQVNLDDEKEKKDDEIAYHEEIIKNIETNISDKSGLIEEINEQIKSTEEAIRKLKPPTKEDIVSKRDREDEISEELEDIITERSELRELEEKIKVALTGTAECPKCSHEFSISNKKLNVEKAKARLDKIVTAKEEIAKDVTRLNKELNDVKNEIRDIEHRRGEYTNKLTQLNNTISTDQSRIERIEETIQEYKEKIGLEKETIQKIKDRPIEDPSIAIKESIKDTQDIIVSYDEMIEQKTKEKEKEALLKGTFTRFKTHLSNKAIGTIEAIANKYLENTKTNLSIQLDGYKTNKKGEIRENITATILRDGLPTGSFTRLSSGEKARIEVAIIMALQRLINNSAGYAKGLDLTWLDEIIESVDSKGIGGIMKSLNNLQQTIIVITHGTFNQTYPHIIKIVKENSVSRVVDEQ